jgi:membrane fusion protein (multidrug efflux system)
MAHLGGSIIHRPGLILFACVAAASLMLAGCGKSNKATPAHVDEVQPVQVVSVQPSNQLRTIGAVGTVRFRRETPLGFTTSGKVSSVRFDEGDYVKRGSLLAALDTTNVVADVTIADAEQSRARSDFERIKQLYADGWVTKARYEAAEAAAKASSGRVSQARFARGTAQLYAPSSGIVLTRNVEPGQVVAVGTPALILGLSDQGFIFRAPIIDADAAKLRVGMTGEITLDALDGEPITAVISEIDGRANQATGAFTVQFSLPARAKLKSGQIGSAAIKLPASNDGGLQIPASALFGVRAGEGLVYVVEPGTNRVSTRNVIIDKLLDGFVIVRGALQPGEALVVSGLEKLRTGTKVRPIRSAE